METDAGGDPEDGDHQEISRDDHGEDGSNGETHPANEAALGGIAGEVVSGEADHDGSEE